MKANKILLGASLSTLLVSGVLITKNITHADNTNVNHESQLSSNELEKKQKHNETIDVALRDFSSLKKFNDYFNNNNLSNENWLIPDLSTEGTQDSGKTHGWAISQTEESAKEYLKRNEEVVKNIASVKDIRAALAERDAKENVAIKTALHDYASLEEFNAKFSPIEDTTTASYTPDEQWMIPDLSDVGSNDGGKSHGWSGFPTKEQAEDSDVVDETGKVVYTFKVSDGASAGAIREALAERDKA